MVRVVFAASPVLLLLMASCCSGNMWTGYYLNNWRSGKCLAVVDEPVDWALVCSTDCDLRVTPESQQLWKFEGYPSMLVHTPSGKCMDVVGPSNDEEGSEIVLNACDAGDLDQYWSSHSRFARTSEGQLVRLMQIKNDLSGLCLDVMGHMDMGNNVPTQLASCDEFGDEDSDQWWKVERV